ncbi:MAG: membrane protein insertion efficiency factor YidD [Burkholderiaceae bacterium]|jgi:putative membrane protein insertion efficiency factor|nr:membrane protein insertion efficiency factor YidD [Burkholderiaceae bacterium]
MKRPTVIARALMCLIRAYQLLLSPWIGQSCRFEPTCSRYALEALERHGAAAGSYLALTRIARCHPGCAGGHDPVPDQPWPLPRLLTGLLHRQDNPASAPTTQKLP